MLTASQPASGYNTSLPTSRTLPRRPLSKDGDKQAIWVPMLNSASKGKDLIEKQLIVLGGTPDQQREFLEQLNPPEIRPRYANNDRRRQPRTAPISNRYALGYTYHDVLDADQEDVLARMNVYTLANSTANFAPLLKPLFTPKTVKDTLITILLDWQDPLRWARQLRQWIRLLRSVILSLDEQTKIEMEEVMTAWKEKRVGPDAPTGLTAEQKSMAVTVPLGPGEWDEGLGIPLGVVCVQAEKIENLERDHGWGEDQFDFLMQWLRCVLLKHGASLVYTSTFDPNNVRTLVHSSLSIHSLLKREVAKHNIVDRDKILIPPNWDSWGKIRILKDGFDPEAVGTAWAVEIQSPAEQTLDFATTKGQKAVQTETETEAEAESQSAVLVYESTLRTPADSRPAFQPRTHDESVTVPPVQEFLQAQYETLDKLKAEDEKAERKSRKGAPAPTGAGTVDADDDNIKGVSNARMAEHIGPYQINVNGIDFDAEEATRRLREREQERAAAATAERSRPSVAAISGTGTGTPMRRQASDVGGAAAGGEGGVQTPSSAAGSGKQSNQAVADFFANLIKKDKRGGVSASASPTRAGSGSPLVRGPSTPGAGGEQRGRQP
ncbi:dynein light intermediate chain 1, cytosolic [Exophiala viscosa]|uniref:Dynein light intermediate chain 1, cytosolic n=1 Tax=Exophiala viscosa TaxID=2486360 RepID=A0AAN6DYH5_9EURO|nr:dynein light intermediate chain 1, cytosolic [Exophiala viscosa]